jgi:hypothetical protein
MLFDGPSFILTAKEFMKGIARDYLPAIAFTPKRLEEGKGKVDKEKKGKGNFAKENRRG